MAVEDRVVEKVGPNPDRRPVPALLPFQLETELARREVFLVRVALGPDPGQPLGETGETEGEGEGDHRRRDRRGRGIEAGRETGLITQAGRQRRFGRGGSEPGRERGLGPESR